MNQNDQNFTALTQPAQAKTPSTRKKIDDILKSLDKPVSVGGVKMYKYTEAITVRGKTYEAGKRIPEKLLKEYLNGGRAVNPRVEIQNADNAIPILDEDQVKQKKALELAVEQRLVPYNAPVDAQMDAFEKLDEVVIEELEEQAYDALPEMSKKPIFKIDENAPEEIQEAIIEKNAELTDFLNRFEAPQHGLASHLALLEGYDDCKLIDTSISMGSLLADTKISDLEVDYEYNSPEVCKAIDHLNNVKSQIDAAMNNGTIAQYLDTVVQEAARLKSRSQNVAYTTSTFNANLQKINNRSLPLMQRVVAARALHDISYTRFDEMKMRAKKNIQLKALSGMTGVDIVAFDKNRQIISMFTEKGSLSTQEFVEKIYAQIDGLAAESGGTPLNAAIQVALNNAKARMNKGGKPTFIDIYGDGEPNDRVSIGHHDYDVGSSPSINSFMHLCITRGETTTNTEELESLAKQFPIQFNACTDDDSSMEWLNLLDNIVIDKTNGKVYKDAEEAKVAGIHKHNLVNLHINTSDDMLSEAKEIYDAQGSMLAITEGVYLILCAVAVLVPALDDLDNPAKILDADGLLSYYGGDFPTPQLVAEFKQAAKKAQAEALYRKKHAMEHHPLDLQGAAKTIYHQDIETHLPSIMRAFENMKVAKLSGHHSYHQSSFGRPIAQFGVHSHTHSNSSTLGGYNNQYNTTGSNTHVGGQSSTYGQPSQPSRAPSARPSRNPFSRRFGGF